MVRYVKPCEVIWISWVLQPAPSGRFFALTSDFSAPVNHWVNLNSAMLNLNSAQISLVTVWNTTCYKICKIPVVCNYFAGYIEGKVKTSILHSKLIL